MDANQYCQDKALKSGSSFYYSFMFLKPVQRQAITAVYAFCREVDDIVDECQDTEVAKKKIAFWHEELNRIYNNEPTHPVGIALRLSLKNYPIKQYIFSEILQGMTMDITYQGYETFEDLKLYCHCVASTVGLIATEIFGYQNSQTLKFARTLGIALQLINIIRDVGEDLQRNRIYIPENELQQYSVTLEDLQAETPSDNFIKLMKFQSERARYYLDEAYKILPKEDRIKQKTAIIMAEIYEKLLCEIELSNFAVLKQRISLTPIRKLWLAYKVNYRENKAAKKNISFA